MRPEISGTAKNRKAIRDQGGMLQASAGLTIESTPVD